MALYNLGARIKFLHRTQRELVQELRKRGINVFESDLSAAINGKKLYPKSERVCAAADEVVTEWEKEAGGRYEH